MEEGKFIGFYMLGGLVKAAVGFDRGGDPANEPDSDMAACGRLVSSRTPPKREQLTDERTDLRSLTR
jgi:hypothetical protein